MTTLQYRNNHEFCTKYVKVKKIGHGGYGDVYKAVDKTSKYPGRYVALKQLKKLDACVDGELPYWAKREVKILGRLKDENVVNLIDVCSIPSTSHDFIHQLVFEYCVFDMLQLISNPDLEINDSAIRDITKQLLAGLTYLHQVDILHWDIKPENILITKEGVLKIADFGLSKEVQTDARESVLTSTAVSLWYRPPELLLGATRYGPKVDIWSAGCVLAQLFSRKVIMRCTTEQDQLLKISEICGSISPEVWPDVRQLDLYETLTLPKDKTRNVKNVLGPDVSSQAALVLIDQMLMLDPRLRPTASLALESDFFLKPITRGDLSALVSAHEDIQNNDLVPQKKKRRTRRGKRKKRCQKEDDIVISAGTVRET